MPFGVHYVPIVNGGANVLAVLGLARALGAARFHILALTPQSRADALPEPIASVAYYDTVRDLWDSAPGGLRIVLSSQTREGARIEERTGGDQMRA